MSAADTPEPRPRDDPRHLLVLGLAVAVTVSWGILFYAFTLFVAPMEAELGWTRPQINAALSAGLLTAGLVAIPTGQWIDRNGGRWLMTGAALLGAACFLVWASVEHLWLFIALWIGIGLAQAGSLYEPVFAVLTANVRDYRRAITLVTFLGGLASTIFLPLTHLLIEHFGWRTALIVLAAIQAGLSAAIYAFVLAGTRGSLQASVGSAPIAFRLGPVLRRRTFQGLFVCFVGYGLMWAAVTFHIIPLLGERGHSLDAIVAAIALIGPSQVAGRLLLFFFGKNASARDIGRIVVLLPIASIVILIVAAPMGFAGLVVFAVVYGLGNGMITIVRGAGVAEILGTTGYGAVSGVITLGNNVAKAAAPLAFALLWQTIGNYGPILWLWTAIMAVSAAAFWYAASAKSIELDSK